MTVLRGASKRAVEEGGGVFSRCKHALVEVEAATRGTFCGRGHAARSKFSLEHFSGDRCHWLCHLPPGSEIVLAPL